MKATLDLLSQILEGYVRVQLALLPVYFFHFVVARNRWGVGKQLRVNHALHLASVLIPVAMLFWPVLNYNYETSLRFPNTYVYAAANGVDRTLNHPYCFTFFSFFSLVALIGLLYLGFLLVLQVMQERLLLRDCTSVRQIGRIRMVFSPKITGSMTTGFLRKTVYLPSRLLGDRKSLTAILAHEAAHIRSGHILFSTLAKIHCSLGWYNPLSHLLAKKGHELHELYCDEKALKKTERADYSRILLQEAEALSTQGGLVLAKSFFPRKLLRKRISAILNEGPLTAAPWAQPFMVAAVLCSALLYPVVGAHPADSFRTGAKQSGPRSPHDPAATRLLTILDNELDFIVREIRGNEPNAVSDSPRHRVVDYEKLEDSRLFSRNAVVEYHYLKSIKMKQIRKYRYSILQDGWYRYHKRLVFDLPEE